VVALAHHAGGRHAGQLLHGVVPGDHAALPIHREGCDGQEVDDVRMPALGFPQRLLRASLFGDIDDADQHVGIGVGGTGM